MIGMIAFTKISLPYGWLGNMAPYPITDETGRIWRTTEHLFQALRFSDEDVRNAIGRTVSAMSAKMLARANASRMTVVPQSEADIDNMRYCLRLKVEQYPELRQQLLATGDELIVEDVTNRQRGSALYWGGVPTVDGSFRGINRLGALWMELRAVLRNG